MTDKTTLIELAARVEAATGPDRELDAEIFRAVLWPDWLLQTNCDLFPDQVKPGRIQEPGGCGWRQAPAYTRSLDAAMTLTKADALGTSDVNAFAALSDAILALEDAGWPKGEWAKVLPRYVAAASLRAIAEGME
jgi:hypothetical protein